MTAPRNSEQSLEEIHRNFISGNHILHHHGVLDAYGHLSVRHPQKPEIFIMSRYIAPGTISSPRDLVEYYVENADPVDPNSPKGYSERCIHSECYRRFKGVHSVIHSHSEEVVPYTINGVPLRPCYHMGGFLGVKVPIYEMADVYRPEDTQDMLVKNTYLGGKLAEKFNDDPNGTTDLPDHPVVLMRGHGLTVCAETIQDCVLRAVYTQKNAIIQTSALTTQGAAGKGAQGLRYLSETEAAAAMKMTLFSAMRPWALWLREIQASGLYVNHA